MEKFKIIDKDHIIVDGKKYKRAKGTTQGCDGCAFGLVGMQCPVEGPCEKYNIWVLDEDQTIADDGNALLLEFFKWLDRRGMLDNTLCYDPEHQIDTFIELRKRKGRVNNKKPKNMEIIKKGNTKIECKGTCPACGTEFVADWRETDMALPNHSALIIAGVANDRNYTTCDCPVCKAPTPVLIQKVAEPEEKEGKAMKKVVMYINGDKAGLDFYVGERKIGIDDLTEDDKMNLFAATMAINHLFSRFDNEEGDELIGNKQRTNTNKDGTERH